MGLDLGLGSSTELRSADRARDFIGGGANSPKIASAAGWLLAKSCTPRRAPQCCLVYELHPRHVCLHLCSTCRLCWETPSRLLQKKSSSLARAYGLSYHKLRAMELPLSVDHLTWATKTPDALLRINYRHHYFHAGCIVSSQPFYLKRLCQISQGVPSRPPLWTPRRTKQAWPSTAGSS